MVNFPEFGVRIGQAREMYPPKIEAGGEAVLSMCDREIKSWPGYGGKCFQRRTKTQRGKLLAMSFSSLLRILLWKVIPGNEEWAIGQLPDGRPGIQGKELFITRLIHRGGSNWQPEIWAPKIIG
ncbi:hypothetical protein BDQ17DRAFT_1359353 [Cyathus striatus]|nr:hypothetical protein BDQ17DRAFT_1359353 [Cyathus striatus]